MKIIDAKATKNVFIFVGVAGSGKTTLITEFAKKKRLKFYDILTVMKSYLLKYGSVTEKNKSILDEVVRKYVKSFLRKNFDILELATGGHLPEIINSLKDRKITVIYCKSPLTLCRKRNKERHRNVPEHYLKYQSQYKTAFYKKLQKELGFKLIRIDMKQSQRQCLMELLKKI